MDCEKYLYALKEPACWSLTVHLIVLFVRCSAQQVAIRGGKFHFHAGAGASLPFLPFWSSDSDATAP